MAVAVLAAVVAVFATYGSPSTIAHRVSHAFVSATDRRHEPEQPTLLALEQRAHRALARFAWNEFKRAPGRRLRRRQLPALVVRAPEQSDSVQDAHNLYVQTLAELGVVGGALLALLLGLPLVAAVRARRHPLAAPRSAPTSPSSCTASSTGTGRCLPSRCSRSSPERRSSSRARGERAGAGSRRPAGRVAIGALAAIAAVVAFVGLIGNIALARSAERDPDGNGAEGGRRGAAGPSLGALVGAGPARPRRSEIVTGSKRAGLADLRRAAAKDPGDWETWFDLAAASSGPARARAVDRVKALNPVAPELDALEQPRPAASP